ncbi:hypothetical protein RE628_02890 [Paenibacillus sp. D2_2]|uniref:hypothetical protein n=1 Tax=Paenibacillus sp. D2_2 TaxID=3073092 RepID=UPI002815ED3B|nr:hypothetical protein [Paenibacillus sp. D2_2]WMT41505.1 hypothetical protein RE628_02890 [Paenibacillus sp. D2_2]
MTIPLLVHKGIGISQKLNAVQTAERLFHEKLYVEAVDWYQKAQNNRTIRYKEELISSRLEELAPITAMKRDLESIVDQASRANREQDFDLLMDAYAKLQQVRSQYLAPEEPYSDYYRQMSNNFSISQNFTSYFKNFRTLFLEQLEQNLTSSNYTDESFKRNLMRIPAHLFGTEQEWLKELNATFQKYDETKLTRMAAQGLIEPMLDNASSMLAEYKAITLDAPWMMSKVDSLMEALLKRDWDNSDYTAFAIHSRQYTSFASSAHPESRLLTYAKGKMDELMRNAKKSVANGNYQEAIDLYTAIGYYQDTKAEISATELAWTMAEPVRLLPALADGSSYTHVVDGRDQFGSKAYVVATDQNNQLYFGRMNAEESIQILTNQDLASQDQIRTLTIDPILSTGNNPVIVIEAASEARKARYDAFEVREDSIALLYSIEADSLTIQPDKTIYAINLVGQGEGQTAIFVRADDHYQFAGIKQEILDISADMVSQYPDTLVRFTSTVIYSVSGETLVTDGNSLILLRGDFSLTSGANVTVTGRFEQNASLNVDEQLIEKIAEVLKELADGSMNELLLRLSGIIQIIIPVIEVDTIQ